MKTPRQRILKWSRRTIAELRQIIIDCEFWMRLHPDEQPLDLEPERLTLAVAFKIRRKALAGIDVDDEDLRQLLEASEGLKT